MTTITTALLTRITTLAASTRLTATSSYAWQMTAVAIILLLCLTWLIVKMRKRFRSSKRSSCCGCSLSQVCGSGNKTECPTTQE